LGRDAALSAGQSIDETIMEQAAQVINGLSKDEVTETYILDMIWAQRSSGYLFNQMWAKLRARAKQVGISAAVFDKIWKAYQAQKLEEERALQDGQKTHFTDQEFELKCGRYQCTDSGITKTQPDRMGDVEITVCTHPIMPISRITNIETGEVQWKLAFKRNFWKQIIVGKQALADKAGIIKALAQYDIAINSNNAQPFVQYLNDMMEWNRETIPEEKSIGRLGWVEGYGFSPYVPDLHYDAAGQYKEEFAAIRQAGSWEKWRDMYKKIRNSGLIATRLVFAASIISPFVSKLGSLPFFYHIWGSQSGIGKTIALRAAASVWADPEMGHFAKTCQSTDVGFEQMAVFCNHLPLILDELQLLKNKPNYNFDRLIYSLCEGVEKVRGAKEGGIRKTHTWSNVMITSGESPITATAKGAGAMARVIEAEYTQMVFDDPPAIADLIRDNYGWAGKMVIDALSDPNSGLTMELIQKWKDDFYQQLGATDKQGMAMSMLMTGDAILGWLIGEPEFDQLTVSQVRTFVRSSDEMNVNLDCYYYICEWIGGCAGRFDDPVKSDDKPVPERYGCWDTENDHLVYVINRYMTAAIKDAGYDPKAFYSWAKANNLIKINGDKVHPYGYRKRLPFRGGDNIWTIALLTGQKIPRAEEHIRSEDD